jgi:hypothetical protein
MTRSVMPEYPDTTFTCDQLCRAWQAAQPWAAPVELFWDVAVSALLDRQVTDAEVAQYRPLIRQAVGEA